MCNLLNVIAPCAVTTFKDAALEYLCLQLESMLENHLLNDLDGDLLLELGEVVRANQLNCLPFAKSGRAELLLHERHPDLAEDIHEERQRRLKDMAFRMTHRDDDNRLSSSYRARIGSLEDFTGSPSQEKLRRKSKTPRNAPFSPSIRPKDSTVDLMFDMDDDNDDLLVMGSPPVSRPALEPNTNSGIESSIRRIPWDIAEPKSLPDEEGVPLLATPSGLGINTPDDSPAPGGKTWLSPALPSSKLDMREIMAQASSSRTSALSQSISAQKAQDEAVGKQARAKLSQKERKKQQQQNMQQNVGRPHISLDTVDGKPASPWQIAGLGQKTSLKDVLSEPKPSPLASAAKSLGSPIPARNLTPRRTASPDTRFAGQSRSGSNSSLNKNQSPSVSSPRLVAGPKAPSSTPVVPHSKSYMTLVGKAEPSLQLSMSDIIGQQRREQEVIKEAVAKRSLQEIQEEQAFQEWWDLESRRAQEEEAVRARNTASGKSSKGSAGHGKGGARSRGGRGRGDSAPGRGRGKAQEKTSATK